MPSLTRLSISSVGDGGELILRESLVIGIVHRDLMARADRVLDEELLASKIHGAGFVYGIRDHVCHVGCVEELVASKFTFGEGRFSIAQSGLEGIRR